nr:hypothetical protein [Allomuricauda sp.]
MLNNIKMQVVQTVPNGIVNNDTYFHFKQDGEMVHAGYSGGKIQQGYLVGTLQENILNFSYCQIRTDGTMDHGTSTCYLSFENGKLQLQEHFEMTTGDIVEKGTNIFRQV